MLDHQREDLKSYIENNVEEFGLRYQLALTKIDHYRCSLDYADRDLYSDIYDTAVEWAGDNDVPVEQVESFIENEYL